MHLYDDLTLLYGSFGVLGAAAVDQFEALKLVVVIMFGLTSRNKNGTRQKGSKKKEKVEASSYKNRGSTKLPEDWKITFGTRTFAYQSFPLPLCL
eukprot:3516107-Amphidinium_carterae.1